MHSGAPLHVRHVSHPLDTGLTAHHAWAVREWPSIGGVYRTTPREPFAMSSDTIRLDDIWLHLANFTAQRWERDAAMIAAHGTDTFNVAITVVGNASGRFGARPVLSGPGSVHFMDLTQESQHESSASRMLLLSIPRCRATAAGLDVAALHGVVRRSAAGEMLVAHLLRLFETIESFRISDASLLARTVLDMVVLTADSASPESTRDVRRAAAAQDAREMIDAQLESPSLSIARLCRELDVSRTTLHRLFESDGGVQTYIRAARLTAVQRLLGDPDGGIAIQDLADRFNFSDAAHLTRTFRAKFGVTPSVFRQQVRNIPAP